MIFFIKKKIISGLLKGDSRGANNFYKSACLPCIVVLFTWWKTELLAWGLVGCLIFKSWQLINHALCVTAQNPWFRCISIYVVFITFCNVLAVALQFVTDCCHLGHSPFSVVFNLLWFYWSWFSFVISFICSSYCYFGLFFIIPIF